MSASQKRDSPAATGLDAEKSTQNAPIVGAEGPERKRLETVRAIAAISGITLHELEGDGGVPVYIATKWNLTRELQTLDEVAAWLNTVTGYAGTMPSQATNAAVIDEADRARRMAFDDTNRTQDALDEAADFLRGPGGEAIEGLA